MDQLLLNLCLHFSSYQREIVHICFRLVIAKEHCITCTIIDDTANWKQWILQVPSFKSTRLKSLVSTSHCRLSVHALKKCFGNHVYRLHSSHVSPLILTPVEVETSTVTRNHIYTMKTNTNSGCSPFLVEYRQPIVRVAYEECARIWIWLRKSIITRLFPLLVLVSCSSYPPQLPSRISNHYSYRRLLDLQLLCTGQSRTLEWNNRLPIVWTNNHTRYTKTL